MRALSRSINAGAMMIYDQIDKSGYNDDDGLGGWPEVGGGGRRGVWGSPRGARELRCRATCKRIVE